MRLRSMSRPMHISYAARTHLGMHRGNNEDNFFVLPEHNLYIVADGMGGHASGEVASLLAVRTMANYFIDSTGGRREEWPYPLDSERAYDDKRLTTGVKLANQGVFEVAQQGGIYRGMGTTLVSLLLGETGAYVAHVGDSRAYVITNNTINQVTEDHSLINEYIKLHKLSPEEIQGFAHKNVIVRALGLAEDVDVDIQRIEPLPGDTYLLCSDGLTDMLEDPEILDIMNESDDIQRQAELLVEGANNAGGVDNTTLVLVRFNS